MSQNDRMFVELSSLPVSEIATILDKSPQAVRRGLKMDDDYLSAGDVFDIIQRMNEVRPGLASVFRHKIGSIYPNYEGIEKAFGRQSNSLAAISGVEGGEFWVISSNVRSLITVHESGAKELLALAKRGQSFLSFFIYAHDSDYCRKFLNQNGITTQTANLHEFTEQRLFGAPSYALYRPVRERMRLFVIHQGGLLEMDSEGAASIVADITSLFGEDALRRDKSVETLNGDN